MNLPSLVPTSEILFQLPVDKNSSLFPLREKIIRGQWIYVSIAQQKLFLMNGLQLEKMDTISTGEKPPSCLKNSLGTPRGWHEICEKIGEKLPEGAVLIGRQPTGLCYQDPSYDSNKRWITSRILRLRGLEFGKNSGTTSEGQSCDTYERLVYIHGTNWEHRIGTPCSQGCVLMKNRDIIVLFEKIDIGTPVLID